MGVRIGDFHQMVEGASQLGTKAATENAHYNANTAGLGKRILLGILTLGIYAMVQSHRDGSHASEMKKINDGVKNFYKALDKLYTIQGRADNEVHDDPQNNNIKVRLARNEYVHLSYEHGKYYYQYQSGKHAPEPKVRIGNPAELLKSIESDVMQHSEDFDKAFVKDMLDTRAGDLGAHNRRGLWQVREEAREAEENNRIDFSQARDMAVKIKPIATESRDRLDTMLRDLFTSQRGGLSESEAYYIDRELGIKLAREIVDGRVTAPDIRAFINRNGSSAHFTTIECAELLRRFEVVHAHDEMVANDKYASTKDRLNAGKTKAIHFKDGYYQPKPNPALPKGDDARIHDFVAKIICDDSMIMQEPGVRNGMEKAQSARLRKLFSENKDLVARLMENAGRADRKEEPSLLETLEPELRDKLQKNLLDLEKKYQEELQQRKDSLKSTLEISKKYEPGLYDDAIKERQRDVDVMSGPEGRKLFINSMLQDQQTREFKSRFMMGGAQVDELASDDLDTLGSVSERDNGKEEGAQVYGREDKGFKPTYAKLTGRPEEEGPYYAGKMLEEPYRKNFEYGVNFFATLEKDIDEGVHAALEKVQADFDKKLQAVFKNMGGNGGQMSLAEFQQLGLKEIIGDQSQDADMLLIKNALGRYFKEMPVMDQRSMLAAQTRFCTSAGSEGAKLGALLKGAGPVMQKMLQGLDPSFFKDQPEFQIALSDMKDKLAPISQDVIHAYLFDVVQNSKGAIKSIEVEKSLGAASVAQTLRCKVAYSDGTSETVVFKMLRPDATMRAEREKAVFDRAAQKVGRGMPMTFQGRYDSIMEELDLRNEARNVEKGHEVYDYNQKDYANNPELQQTYGSFSNVHSMELFGGIAPSANVMALKEAKGESLDSYLEDIGTKAQQVVKEAGSRIESIEDPAAQAEQALEGAKELGRLYDDCKAKYQALTNLSYMWANEGLFASGFYHGDVHKGNIMVDKGVLAKPGEELGQPGATLIDFGNAVNLDAKGKKQVIQAITGTAVGDFAVFDKGFKAMLSPESRRKYDDAIRNGQLKEKLTHILSQGGGLNGTAVRLTAMLKVMQRDYQIEVPGHIHNFLESQKRLQACLNETKLTMDAIARDREQLMQGRIDAIEDEEARAEVSQKISDARNFKAGGIMKAITDVVKQNLVATLKSLGSDTRRCFKKIQGQLDEHGNIIDNEVGVLDWNDVQNPNVKSAGSVQSSSNGTEEGSQPEQVQGGMSEKDPVDLNGMPLNNDIIFA